MAIKIRNNILNLSKKCRNKEFQLNFLEKKLKIDLQKTKEFFKNNKDLLITKADKGNTIVIIEKQSYIEKMNTLFSDPKYYVEVKKNQLLSLEKNTDNLIKKLNNVNFSMDNINLDSVSSKCNIAR